MSLGENSLVAAYQGRGQLKSRPSGTRVVTTSNLPLLTKLTFIKQICDLFYVIYIAPFKITFQS